MVPLPVTPGVPKSVPALQVRKCIRGLQNDQTIASIAHLYSRAVKVNKRALNESCKNDHGVAAALQWVALYRKLLTWSMHNCTCSGQKKSCQFHKSQLNALRGHVKSVSSTMASLLWSLVTTDGHRVERIGVEATVRSSCGVAEWEHPSWRGECDGARTMRTSCNIG